MARISLCFLIIDRTHSRIDRPGACLHERSASLEKHSSFSHDMELAFWADSLGRLSGPVSSTANRITTSDGGFPLIAGRRGLGETAPAFPRNNAATIPDFGLVRFILASDGEGTTMENFW